jgi:hypothetical protein
MKIGCFFVLALGMFAACGGAAGVETAIELEPGVYEQSFTETEIESQTQNVAASGYAIMNCWTGSCRCYNLSDSTCQRSCDILWDENCSKPAAQQLGAP